LEALFGKVTDAQNITDCDVPVTHGVVDQTTMVTDVTYFASITNSIGKEEHMTAEHLVGAE
jgi:hypothetical protein